MRFLIEWLSVMDKSMDKPCKVGFYAIVAIVTLLMYLYSAIIGKYNSYLEFEGESHQQEPCGVNDHTNTGLESPPHQRTTPFRSKLFSDPCHKLVLNSTEYVPVDTDVCTYDYKYRQDIHYRSSSSNCTLVKFPTELLPITALASLPGSGNTWTRHLIQLVTGQTALCELHLVKNKDNYNC